ncbi:Poly(A) polymerase central domain-containing protein [Sporodiniella umbellata]|nr:Poly(A) polymerase central domain-containing protein [Sporodiniella umbellata]
MAVSLANISNIEWHEYLKNKQIVESLDEQLKRKSVIELLQRILLNFQAVAAKEIEWKRGEIECLLSPFGSYGLGGYIRGADIDLVLVCPQVVTRKLFFSIFPHLLKQQPLVNRIECIQKANVPIIKCTVDNISIDISFVRLKAERITSQIDFLDDKLLQEIDETCAASMDGPRVNQFYKKQILHEHAKLFQTSLQCVKYWAKQRGIYNKPLGYLNGSSWTLLLIKTYLSIDNKQDLTITKMLYIFFNMWCQWPWQTPVMLESYVPGINGTKVEYSSLSDFQNSVMPIVSPCYPVCNVSPYVTKTTKKVIQLELERGREILTRDDPSDFIICKLFNPLNYFNRYQHFIVIITSSTVLNSHDIWTRKMATYIPKYLELIETEPDILFAQPMMEPHQNTVYYQTLEEKAALKNGDLQHEAQINDYCGMISPGTLHLTYHMIGITINKNCNFYF